MCIRYYRGLNKYQYYSWVPHKTFAEYPQIPCKVVRHINYMLTASVMSEPHWIFGAKVI